MKAAAAQVGIDPSLVEQAARLVAANVTTAPSFMERLFGGRARYRGEAHYPIVLDEAGVAAFYEGHLLSVLTIRTDGERILDVYALLNPDKLQGFELPAVH